MTATAPDGTASAQGLSPERWALVASHLPLLGHVMRRLRLGPLDATAREMCRDRAMDALIHAASRFDASRGVSFTRYAKVIVTRAAWEMADRLFSRPLASQLDLDPGDPRNHGREE